jgi:chromosome segregation ATPase
MARKANTTKTTKSATRKRRPLRSVATGAKAATSKKGATRRKVSAPSKRASTMRAPAPTVSRDELRTQVERLERDNKMLRDQSKEVAEAARAAAARFAELEDQVARLETRLDAESADVRKEHTASSTSRHRHTHRREIDPGDSVPPGVAVEEPAPPDLETETARLNLERHLGTGQP